MDHSRRRAVMAVFAVLGAWVAILELQVVAIPGLHARPDHERLRAQRDRGARGAAVPRRRLAGAARAERVAADRHRRARVGARQPLLHGRPLRPGVAADPLAGRRRLPPLPGARMVGVLALVRARTHDVPKTLWTDGSIAALAVTARERRRDLPDRVRQRVGQDDGGGDDARLPAHRPAADRRHRRRAREHRLAARPHVGDAGRRHRRVLDRRLLLPRRVRHRHALVALLVRHRLVARPAAGRVRLMAAGGGATAHGARRAALHLRSRSGSARSAWRC